MDERIGLLCRYIKEHPHCSQRELAAHLEISLGTVNTLMKECARLRLTAQEKSSAGTYELTGRGDEFLDQFQVDGALIIAAGFGSRFVPLTFETPKGLLEVFGERMIERQIRQLHEAGITDVTIVVGYLKEKFEYLIDKYGVKLLYNPEYSCKNTLATIWHAREVLRGRNMYLLASDNWLRENMFHRWECRPWYASAYMAGDTSEWALTFNKKNQITEVNIGGHDTWVMYGPAFFTEEFSGHFLPLIEQAYATPGTEQFYWEHVLMRHIRALPIYINRQPDGQIYEFENLEELRQFDPKYQTRSDNRALELVSEIFDVPESEIHKIRCLKSGMTNQSFLFQIKEHSYICRIPGKGTELLIDRAQEAAVYEAIRPLGISEHLVYLDSRTGYKISSYFEGARNARARDWDDMAGCMKMLHRLHESGATVAHTFDIRERISFYERLCQTNGGTRFEDYDEVRSQMNQLMDQLDGMEKPQALAHIDSCVDNILFLPDGSLRLIDWEYAGMCDPLQDVAMCAIYSYYNEEEVDRLMCLYLGREPDTEERFRIYAGVALGGFLWSLWGVYKSALGVEFGDYTLAMYRYAKRYYRKIFPKL